MNSPDPFVDQPRNTGSFSGRSPDEIESEIERTRAELDRTLHALQSKLSPRERLHAAADSFRSVSERVMRQTRSTLTPHITTLIRMDHTHVLALFRRYRPGVSDTRKRALVTNACLALEIHAQLEEEIFYPALLRVAGHSEALDKSQPEHDQMRALIRALRTMEVGDTAYDDTFRMLMRTVLHHVADEESILLPQAEMLMADQLGELGAQMTRRRIELLRPHLGEVAVTTARSFPVGTGLVAAGLAASVVALSWLLLRPSRSRSYDLRSRHDWH